MSRRGNPYDCEHDRCSAGPDPSYVGFDAVAVDLQWRELREAAHAIETAKMVTAQQKLTGTGTTSRRQGTD